jgi:hypothetical protein
VSMGTRVRRLGQQDVDIQVIRTSRSSNASARRLWIARELLRSLASFDYKGI